MTLIIGFEHDDKATVCVDSGVWSGNHVAIMKGQKVWRAGPYVVAVCGSVMAQWIAQNTTIDDPNADTPQAYVNRIVDAIAARNRDDIKNSFGIVIAQDDSVWSGGSDGGLMSVEHGVVCEGVCAEFAEGAFLGARSEFNSEFCARRAMLLAAERTDGCKLPIRWMSTDGEEGVWE